MRLGIIGFNLIGIVVVILWCFNNCDTKVVGHVTDVHISRRSVSECDLDMDYQWQNLTRSSVLATSCPVFRENNTYLDICFMHNQPDVIHLTLYAMYLPRVIPTILFFIQMAFGILLVFSFGQKVWTSRSARFSDDPGQRTAMPGEADV